MFLGPYGRGTVMRFALVLSLKRIGVPEGCTAEEVRRGSILAKEEGGGTYVIVGASTADVCWKVVESAGDAEAP